MRIRTVAKDGALAALVASEPRVQAGNATTGQIVVSADIDFGAVLARNGLRCLSS